VDAVRKTATGWSGYNATTWHSQALKSAGKEILSILDGEVKP